MPSVQFSGAGVQVLQTGLIVTAAEPPRPLPSLTLRLYVALVPLHPWKVAGTVEPRQHPVK